MLYIALISSLKVDRRNQLKHLKEFTFLILLMTLGATLPRQGVCKCIGRIEPLAEEDPVYILPQTNGKYQWSIQMDGNDENWVIRAPSN